MRLSELCKEAENIIDCDVSGVSDNTNSFENGNIFVCIKGNNFDGHSVAADMLEKGATAIVAERDLGVRNQIIVPNSRKYLSLLAKRFHGEPTNDLELIAITGTNGKSTVTALIQFILNDLGYKCGSIGTVGYDVCASGAKTASGVSPQNSATGVSSQMRAPGIYQAEFTTPRPMELYRYFREMVDNGAKYCVIEASSQALAQSRFDNENVKCGVFTNLTRDHLDYHGGMEEYYKAKRSLFDMCEKAVVCIDDKYGRKLLKYINEELKIPVDTYSTKDVADFFAINIKYGNNGTSYWLNSMGFEKSFPVKLKLPGRFNISNSMAAVAAVTALGININDAVNAVQKCEGVIGRSEIIYNGKFTVIRDYAHTPDALEKFLTGIKTFAEGRILCLFGAAGERDASKRPMMGETAARLSDFMVITSDNPRFEDQQKIINEVAEGIKNHITPYETYTDRYDAIKAILKNAKEKDLVVLCGKGHEVYQVVGDESLPFDEKVIVNEILGG